MERKIQSLTSEVTQLRDSLNKVMPELEGYRNSPEKLCSNIDECKHSKKCTFYTLRFGCSFAAVNTIKPQLL